MALLQKAAKETRRQGVSPIGRSGLPPGYADHRVPSSLRLEYWSKVFPLGMYTAATWTLSNQKGAYFLAVILSVCIWAALALCSSVLSE
jgi:hypothetical protein